jgi:hypothetical protein
MVALDVIIRGGIQVIGDRYAKGIPQADEMWKSLARERIQRGRCPSLI